MFWELGLKAVTSFSKDWWNPVYQFDANLMFHHVSVVNLIKYPMLSHLARASFRFLSSSRPEIKNSSKEITFTWFAELIWLPLAKHHGDAAGTQFSRPQGRKNKSKSNNDIRAFFFSLLPHWHTNAQTHFKSQSTKGNQISKFPRQFLPRLPLSHFPSAFLINIQAPYNFFHFLFPFSISTCLAFICPLPQAELFQRSWIFHLSLLPSYHLNTNKFMMIFTSILPLQIAHGSHRGAAVASVR